ncbi:hypothetical protein GA0070613_5400 [Micromonospora inositola]|uniref:Uncharacterized protein n=1 Tax=Micromonospora inositola TaxID=47865 RepID=A0A1C5JTM8_9ACTN|nr:hypothetical protein GA0070613_5400 [Micromonospora inositola]
MSERIGARGAIRPRAGLGGGAGRRARPCAGRAGEAA